MPGNDLILQRDLPEALHALARTGLDNIYAGQLLARALNPWRNNTIKVYEPTLAERWPQILSAAERESHSMEVPFIVLDFNEELAGHWRREDRSEFYRAFCSRIVDGLRPTKLGDTASFKAFDQTLRGNFPAIYRSFDDKRRGFWQARGNFETVVDPLTNVGGNVAQIFKAMGWNEGTDQSMPHIILHLSQIPVLARGIVSPLSPAEEASITPTPEGEELGRRLSTSIGLMQEFIFGTQESGAHFTTILGGWILDSLRAGYAENQRWNHSIFREGAVLEELQYHEIHEI
jgi:hypothetical protein